MDKEFLVTIRDKPPGPPIGTIIILGLLVALAAAIGDFFTGFLHNVPPYVQQPNLRSSGEIPNRQPQAPLAIDPDAQLVNRVYKNVGRPDNVPPGFRVIHPNEDAPPPAGWKIIGR